MSAPVYGWEVDIAVRTGIFSEVVRTHHYRGVSESRARRNAMLTRNALRILAVRAIEEDEFIRAYGLGTEGGRVGGGARRKQPGASLLALPVVLLLACGQPSRPAQAAEPVYGWMGDSLTRQIDQSSLAAGAGVPLSSVVVSGVNGTTSRDWLPGRSYYNSALASFQAAGVSVVSLCLGTNDAKAVLRFAPAEVELNLTLIGKGLLAAGMSRVVLNYSPYVVPGSAAGAWGTDAPELVAAYNARREGAVASINAVYPGRASVGDALAYDWFRDRQELLADGVHPGPVGNAWLADRWGSVARDTGIVLPESLAGVLVAIVVAFLFGALCGQRGWRWWR